MKPYDTAIIGGGFSGLLSLAHLVKTGPAGARYAVFEPCEHLGQGLAYATRQTVHLLNVPAGGMSAFPDQPDHLVRWLELPAGKKSARALGVSENWTADDYIPRALYALYLGDIAAAVFAQAAEKNIAIDHIRDSAVDINNGVKTEKSFYPARKILLALGNTAAARGHADIVGDVFGFDYTTLKQGPVAIIGTGLTMVDTLMSLRAGGYTGKVIALSRRGLLPHVHDDTSFDYPSRVKELAQQPQKLLTLMRAFRQETDMCMAQGGSWQPVFRQWRPYLVTLWGGLDVRERKRFLSSLFTLWGIHRHRMAGKIGEFVRHELDTGGLVLSKGTLEGQNLAVEKIFDCRGPGYDITRTTNVLLKNMLKKGAIRPHATGWGIAPGAFFVIGPLLIGEQLETTAVPELRAQAQRVAGLILSG